MRYLCCVCYNVDMSGAPSNPRRSADDWGWREFVDNQLANLQRLPDNSDGWTAHRPANYVVQTARQAAEQLITSSGEDLPNPFIAATSEGGLQLKWSTKDRELSLFIYPDQSIEFLFVHSQREPSSGSVEVNDIPRLSRLLLE